MGRETRNTTFVATLVAAVIALTVTSSARADETYTHPATTYKIDQVIEMTKGPYQPGDLIAFDVKTALPRDQFHFFQVTGECLSAPAAWHIGTENKFVNNDLVRKGYAVATVTSGCTDGVRQVLEVEIEDSDKGYARIAYDGESSILSYVVTNGHLFPNADNSLRKPDSISTKNLPSAIRMSSQRPFKVWTLPGLTKNGQTINWVANGVCKFRRGQGEGDINGDLVAKAPGKCYLSANTPWGSNLFQPVNIAMEIKIYPHTALLCINQKNKKLLYTEKALCPKGYTKK